MLNAAVKFSEMALLVLAHYQIVRARGCPIDWGLIILEHVLRADVTVVRAALLLCWGCVSKHINCMLSEPGFRFNPADYDAVWNMCIHGCNRNVLSSYSGNAELYALHVA